MKFIKTILKQKFEIILKILTNKILYLFLLDSIRMSNFI